MVGKDYTIGILMIENYFKKEFYSYTIYMGKTKCERKIDKLMKQTDFFINHYNETIDEGLKKMIKCIARNFENFLGRKKSVYYDCFDMMLFKIESQNKLIKRKRKLIFSYNSLAEREFIIELIYLNAEVLRRELENSLTDRRYRYPRCPHFEREVKHALYVKACCYSKETEKDHLLILICDECEDYLNFSSEIYRFMWLDTRNLRDYREIIGCEYIEPLNFSMY